MEYSRQLKRHKRYYREQQVAECQKNGLTQNDFSLQNNLNPWHVGGLEIDFWKLGVKIHYFPYTQQTLSTKLRAVIDEIYHSKE